MLTLLTLRYLHNLTFRSFVCRDVLYKKDIYQMMLNITLTCYKFYKRWESWTSKVFCVKMSSFCTINIWLIFMFVISKNVVLTKMQVFFLDMFIISFFLLHLISSERALCSKSGKAVQYTDYQWYSFLFLLATWSLNGLLTVNLLHFLQKIYQKELFNFWTNMLFNNLWGVIR